MPLESPSVFTPRWTPSNVLNALDRRASQPVVVTVVGGQSQSYSGYQIAALVRGVATEFAQAGVGTGDTVAIWAPNSPNWVAAGIACHFLGVILAPVDAMLSVEEARLQIAASDPDLTLVGSETAHIPSSEVPHLALENILPSEQPLPDVGFDPDAPIALFRTSGTTGTPKKFHLTLGNIGWNVAVITESGEVSERDRILMPLPMHHVFPWISATLSSMTLGATLVLPESPTGPHLSEAMKLTRPTILVGVPRLYEAVLEAVRFRLRRVSPLALSTYAGLVRLSGWLRRMSGGRFGPFLLSPVRRMIAPGLRLVISGGAHLKLETELEMEALGWDVRGGYGLAETASSITAPLGGKKPGSTGRVVEGCAITIADTNTEGIGEILVKGPVVFSGYIDKPDANAKAFTKDGFFRTGDLGYLDEDGFLFVTGRKKEVIVLAGGDNIFPEEVEERYLGHTAVQEIGVFEKDGALVAVVLPDMADIARRRLIDPREVVSIAVAEIGKTLPSTWRLSGFVMTREPLPRTRLLKLRRFMLPAIYEDLLAGRPSGGAAPLSQEDLAWLAEDPQKTVWKLLQDRYPSSNLSLDGYISFELGLDSFGWMNLSLLIEDELEVRLSLSDIARIATARDFLKIVAERKLSGNAAEPRRNLVLDAVTRWLSPRTRFERILGHILYGANAVLMRMAFRVQLEGVDYVTPLKGRPFIICPNHVSDLDALALAAAVPAWLRSSIRWSGSRGAAFGTSFRSGIARAVGMFPVDQESPMVAVDLAAEALDRGLVQVWFPEGLLSPDGKLLLFHEGIGHVISRTSVPVVPAIMDGTYKAMPRERTFPRLHRIRVIFGPPVDPAELTSGLEGGKPDMKNIADRLREKLLATGDAHGIDLRGKADSP